MKLRNVKVIFLKEMLETLRDKRTLMVMILGPVLVYPVLILAFSQMQSIQETRLRERPTTVYLLERRSWPKLKKALAEEPALRVVETTESRLKNENDVLVKFDSRRAKEENREIPSVVLTYRQTNVHAEKGKERVLAALEKYARKVASEKVELSKGERYVYPLIIEENNLSSPSERLRSVLAMTLPMILVLMTIAGAMYPAIDTTAGEKERGTIETILASGKFLSVFLICIATGLLNLVAMSLTFVHVLGGVSESIVRVSSVALVLVSLVPLAVLFSALMMAVSTYARTFREAQNYVTPIYLLCLIPAMMSVQRGFELNDFLCLVPVINMSLFFREVMEGSYIARHILLVFASTSVYASLALRAAVKLFRDENALFSLEKPFALFVRRRVLRAKPNPSLGEAVFACMLVFILFYYVSPGFQGVSIGGRSFVWGTMLSEWLLILLPVLLFARYLKVDFRNTFSFRKFSPVHVFAVLLMFVGSFFLLLELAVLQKHFIPAPVEFSEKLTAGLKRADFWLAVMAIAVSPAICEEIMFRGFVLAGFGKFSRWPRILINGILFGLYHLLLFRMLPTAFLGVVIAFLVVYSGSIFPGMLFHLTNNFVGLAVIYFSTESAAFFKEIGLGENAADWFEGKVHLPWFLLVASAAVLFAGAALTWRFRPREKRSSAGETADSTPGQVSNEEEIQQR